MNCIVCGKPIMEGAGVRVEDGSPVCDKVCLANFRKRVGETRRTEAVVNSAIEERVQPVRNKLLARLAVGVMIALAGGAFTLATYEVAKSSGGGRYVLAYGPIAAGALTALEAGWRLWQLRTIERSMGGNADRTHPRE